VVTIMTTTVRAAPTGRKGVTGKPDGRLGWSAAWVVDAAEEAVIAQQLRGGRNLPCRSVTLRLLPDTVARGSTPTRPPPQIPPHQ